MSLYLDHVAKAWKRILRCGDTLLAFSAVDAVTVKSLELLAPKYSDIDKSLVIDLMERGVIFPSQNERGIRKTLLENICDFPGVIPSLWTFFETLKYLEPLCEALRRLLGEQMKRTIRRIRVDPLTTSLQQDLWVFLHCRNTSNLAPAFGYLSVN
jgi:hypothetical protein